MKCPDEKLCEICNRPIPQRSYQSTATARACSPSCAGSLFKKENPGWAGRWPREVEEPS